MTRVEVVAGIIIKCDQHNRQHVLLAKRQKSQHQGGLWEFPGGKIDPPESQQSALSRELKEELNILIQDSSFFERVEFDYSDKNIGLNFFLVTRFTGQELGLEGQQIKWVPIDKLSEYQFPKANSIIVDRLIFEPLALD